MAAKLTIGLGCCNQQSVTMPEPILHASFWTCAIVYVELDEGCWYPLTGWVQATRNPWSLDMCQAGPREGLQLLWLLGSA